MDRPEYMDFMASHPVDPEVARLVYETMLEYPGNPGSRTHEYGNRAKKRLEEARRDLARVVECEPNEIIFTSCATESNNLATLGLAEHGRHIGRKHIVTTSIEHKSVLEPLQRLAEEGFSITHVSPVADGRVNSADVMEAIQSDTLLVSVMGVNNETGVIQPCAELREMLSKTEILFHVDAAQSFCKLDAYSAGLHADLCSLSGHKIGAPAGIGALVVRRDKSAHSLLRPLFLGGGQERSLRPGTTPLSLAVGLAAAAVKAEKSRVKTFEEIFRIRELLLELLRPIPHRLLAPVNHALPHCVSVTLPGVDAETVFVLAKEIAAVSNGSACNSSNYSVSHVLRAQGVSTEDAECTIRISLSENTTESSLRSLVHVIESILT